MGKVPLHSRSSVISTGAVSSSGFHADSLAPEVCSLDSDARWAMNTHAITAVAFQRKAIFQRTANAELLVKTIFGLWIVTVFFMSGLH
jgi:hypothetical protein